MYFLKFIIYQTNIIINRFNILKSKNELEEKKQLGKIKVINRFYEIFTTLLFNFRNKVGIYSGHNADKIYQNPQNKILLCSIGKEENLYAKEFVEYYLSIGFDKIISFLKLVIFYSHWKKLIFKFKKNLNIYF